MKIKQTSSILSTSTAFDRPFNTAKKISRIVYELDDPHFYSEINGL